MVGGVEETVVVEIGVGGCGLFSSPPPTLSCSDEGAESPVEVILGRWATLSLAAANNESVVIVDSSLFELRINGEDDEDSSSSINFPFFSKTLISM